MDDSDIDDFKALEMDYMALKDQYAELARVLGSPADAMYGDPFESHNTILERARVVMGWYERTKTPI